MCTAVLSEAWAKLRDWAGVAGRGQLLLSSSIAHASLITAVDFLICCLIFKQLLARLVGFQCRCCFAAVPLWAVLTPATRCALAGRGATPVRLPVLAVPPLSSVLSVGPAVLQLQPLPPSVPPSLPSLLYVFIQRSPLPPLRRPRVVRLAVRPSQQHLFCPQIFTPSILRGRRAFFGPRRFADKCKSLVLVLLTV